MFIYLQHLADLLWEYPLIYLLEKYCVLSKGHRFGDHGSATQYVRVRRIVCHASHILSDSDS